MIDPTLRRSRVKEVDVQAPYSAHDDALHRLVVEIEALCRRHLLKPVSLVVDKLHR